MRGKLNPRLSLARSTLTEWSAALRLITRFLVPPPMALQLVASSGPGQDDEEVVTGRRRRPSGEGPRERADAPQRDRADQPERETGGGSTQAPRPSSYVPRPSAGSPAQPSIGLPGGGMSLGVLIIGGLLLLVCIFIAMSMAGGGGGQDQGGALGNAPSVNQPLQEPTALPTATRAPATAARATNTPAGAAAPAAPTVGAAAPAVTKGQKWLVMLYQDADDKVLEQDIYIDLNEAERVGSTDRVQIVAQIDRYRGGYAADGDWVGARRYYVTKDSDLTRVASKVISEGEVNMSEPKTLVDFATWAMKTYPADKYVLIMSDHGMGWPGGFSDAVPPATGHDKSIPLVAALGDVMTLSELDGALQTIRSQAGVDKFEMVGLDACLMSHLEVYTALAPHARYAVASQETEPSLGWAYTAFLTQLVNNPDVSGGDLGRSIVQTYIQGDQRIVDDQARAELLGRSSGMGGLFGAAPQASAAEVAQQFAGDVTLTTVDLSRLPALMSSVNDLALAMQDANPKAVAQARSYAQSFTSVFGRQIPPSYIDLGNFAQLVKRQSGSQYAGQVADRVISDLGQFVISEKHGRDKPGANGVSIYFPTSEVYASAQAGARSYTAIASRFADASLWDDFLTFFYTGRRFQASTASRSLPQSGAALKGPASGGITISPLRLSSSTAAPGKPTTLSADIQGQNIGYIYLFAGYVDKTAKSIFVADMEYLESSTTRELQGVYYPEWPTNQFKLQFEWEPLMFAITDGKTSATVLLKPESFGASGEEAMYSVDGIYTYASGGETRYARLYFSNGVLRHVYGFQGDQNTGIGAPSEILPSSGDKFTILEQWLDQATSTTPAKSATQKGKTLTFGNRTFEWKELDAAAGDYVVGFIVEDLDGQKYTVYNTVTVK